MSIGAGLVDFGAGLVDIGAGLVYFGAGLVIRLDMFLKVQLLMVMMIRLEMCLRVPARGWGDGCPPEAGGGWAALIISLF